MGKTSEYFFCPHCYAQIKKSAAQFVLGQAEREGGQYIVLGLGESQTLSCPRCDGPLDNAAIIKGGYDNITISSVTGLLLLLFVFGGWIGGTILSMTEWDFSFFPALGIGYCVAMVAAAVFIGVCHARRGLRRRRN